MPVGRFGRLVKIVERLRSTDAGFVLGVEGHGEGVDILQSVVVLVRFALRPRLFLDVVVVQRGAKNVNPHAFQARLVLDDVARLEVGNGVGLDVVLDDIHPEPSRRHSLPPH